MSGPAARASASPVSLAHRQGGQAPLRIVSMDPEMLTHQRVSSTRRDVSRAPCRTSSSPRERDLSATQAVKAPSNASRSMKLFWKASRPNRRLRSGADASGACWSRRRGLREGRLDHRGVVGKSTTVLDRVGLLADGTAVLQLHRQQLGEQCRTERRVGGGQNVLDRRPTACPQVVLEAAAQAIDLQGLS